MSYIENIILNIIGGIAAGFAVLGIEHLYKFFHACFFRHFFGVDEKYNIIYCLYNAPVCPHSNPDCKLVFGKETRHSSGTQPASGINLKQVTSVASAKGVGYLVEAFSRNLKKTPTIVADIDPAVETRADISFVSIGGRTSHKTCDLFDNPSNNFLEWDLPQSMAVKATGEKIKIANAEQGNDFGFIVKIHPNNDYKRTWICCFGFGIVGTIGAAYYLARKWQIIRKYVGNQPFGLVIQSRVGSEDSSIPVNFLIYKTNYFRGWLQKWRGKKNGVQITFIEASHK